MFGDKKEKQVQEISHVERIGQFTNDISGLHRDIDNLKERLADLDTSEERMNSGNNCLEIGDIKVRHYLDKKHDEFAKAIITALRESINETIAQLAKTLQEKAGAFQVQHTYKKEV